jgi:xylose dehydrogenase (NAD/NADP)
MNKVRWGLLSTARINSSLIPAIRASARGELVAVASRDIDRAEKYAHEWEIPRWFGGYEEMLDSGEIDAVYISLPNHLHAEWTIRALRAGVHVLCEKPFAISMQEVDDMISASHKSGKKLAEAFMYRHHPQTRIAGEFVRQGNLGDLSHAWGTFCFMIKDRDDVRLVPSMGGGSLWDVGIYPLSMAQYFFGGPPTSVLGMQWVGNNGVDETFTGQMRYPGDRFAQISCSFRTEFHIHFEITGTKGRLSINRPFTSMDEERHLIFHPNKGKPVELKVPETELYIGEVEDMHAAILDNTPNYVTLDETRDHVRTALALYESAHRNIPMDVSWVH